MKRFEIQESTLRLQKSTDVVGNPQPPRKMEDGEKTRERREREKERKKQKKKIGLKRGLRLP
jgi:hypothetical protein